MDADGNPTPIDRKFQTVAFDRTIKELCSNCNNGWMNQPEIDAEAVILALVRGENRDLDVDSLDVLIRWAAKTSFVLEAAETKRRAGHREQFLSLASGIAPSGYYLWIYPLLPNGQIKFRHTEISFPPKGSTRPIPGSPMLTFVSIQFFEAHFLSALTYDIEPKIMKEAINLERVLGHPVQDRINGWSWPPATPNPVEYHDVIQTTAVKYVRDRWNWILEGISNRGK